jgi:hypothetical protein
MEEISNPVPEPEVKRPVLLTVLCVLTYIGSGLNLFSSLLIFFFYNTFLTLGAELSKTFNMPGVDLILNASRSFFGISALIYLLSLTGAHQMWNLRKRGFHFYAIAQILLIILPMYFFKLAVPSISDIIFSGIFLILYWTNLKHMS